MGKRWLSMAQPHPSHRLLASLPLRSLATLNSLARPPHLIEVGQRAALAAAIEVRNVDKLEVERKARVGGHKGGLLADRGQIAQVAIPPIVQLGQRGTCSSL